MCSLEVVLFTSEHGPSVARFALVANNSEVTTISNVLACQLQIEKQNQVDCICLLSSFQYKLHMPSKMMSIRLLGGKLVQVAPLINDNAFYDIIIGRDFPGFWETLMNSSVLQFAHPPSPGPKFQSDTIFMGHNTNLVDKKVLALHIERLSFESFESYDCSGSSSVETIEIRRLGDGQCDLRVVFRSDPMSMYLYEKCPRAIVDLIEKTGATKLSYGKIVAELKKLPISVKKFPISTKNTVRQAQHPPHPPPPPLLLDQSVICDARECNRHGTLLCSSCRFVRYCSKECQARCWKAHRKVCQKA